MAHFHLGTTHHYLTPLAHMSVERLTQTPQQQRLENGFLLCQQQSPKNLGLKIKQNKM